MTRKLPGSAARKLTRIGQGHGFECVAPESFYVEGAAGPLLPEELGRARTWGARLASEIGVSPV